MAITDILDDQFEQEVLKSETPVVVKFHAEWCGPCKVLTPIVEEVAKEFAGKVKVVGIDIDKAPETPAKFGVMGVPTLIFFKDGKEISRRVGGAPPDALKEQFASLS